jgi:hypothetical protein
LGVQHAWRDEKCKLENEQGTRPFGRPKGGWEGNIQNNLGEISLEVVKWVHLTRNRFQWRILVNKVMCLHVFQEQILEQLDSYSF